MKIAFLDSGIGGLTVAAKTFAKRNGEFLYYADSDNMPYGAMTAKVLTRHICKVTEKLIDLGAGVIVLACNTATAVCVDVLRERFPDVIFVGTEPAVKPAMCFDGDVIVLATPLTLAQPRFAKLLYGNSDKIFYTPDCSSLAAIVERDFPFLKNAERAVDVALAPYLGKNVGSVVIGCTHYAYLKAYLAKRYPFRIVSGAGGVVRQLLRVAPEECFSRQSLLRVFSGDREKQSLLEERAALVCKVAVAPL